MQTNAIPEFIRRWPLVLLMLVILLPLLVAAAEDGPPTKQSQGLQQRIDFGSSQILGQSIKSGAVYLMHRKKSDIKSMIEVREHYRNEIIDDFGLEKTALTGATVNAANTVSPQHTGSGGDGKGSKR